METTPRNTLSLKTAQEWGKVASVVFRIVLGLILIIAIPLVYIEMRNNPARVNGTDFQFLMSVLKENVMNKRLALPQNVTESIIET